METDEMRLTQALVSIKIKFLARAESESVKECYVCRHSEMHHVVINTEQVWAEYLHLKSEE